MNHTIRRYALRVDQPTEVSLYGLVRRKPVLVAVKDRELCVWLEVDHESTSLSTLTYVVVLTGNLIPERGNHRGSLIAGAVVLHVYEILPSDPDMVDEEEIEYG